MGSTFDKTGGPRLLKSCPLRLKLGRFSVQSLEISHPESSKRSLHSVALEPATDWPVSGRIPEKTRRKLDTQYITMYRELDSKSRDLRGESKFPKGGFH